MNTSNDVLTSSRRQVLVGLAAGAAIVGAAGARGNGTGGIAHNAEAIHQEVFFKASRSRVFTLLTDAREFQQVVARSGAVQSGKVKADIPAQIGREVGAAFSIFGGFISGRSIELVTDTRLVQAWRPQYWPPGVFSIVKFALVDHEAGTRLTFDHAAFPTGAAESLAEGWQMNYWEPMAKVLAR